MGKFLRKSSICLVCCLLIGTIIIEINKNNEVHKQKESTQLEMYFYARDYGCELESFDIKESEYTFALSKTPNTDAFIRYYQQEGYHITYDDVASDYKKGMEVLESFCKDHGIEDIGNVRSAVVVELGAQGYTWKNEE
jgi:hypothetical protein